MLSQVIQAKEAALNATTNKLNKEKKAAEEKKAASEKREPTFHDRERARLATMTDDKMANTQTAGDVEVATFFSRLHNANHPGHNATLSVFKNKYGRSEAKARAGIMAAVMERQDCHPVENRDLAFEAKTMEEYRPKKNVSKSDLAHYDILKNQLNEEWQRGGYKRTKDVIAAWGEKYL